MLNVSLLQCIGMGPLTVQNIQNKHTEQISYDNTKKYWISKLPSQLFHKPETFLLNILKIKTKNTVGISLLDFKSYYAITINKRQCNCLYCLCSYNKQETV